MRYRCSLESAAILARNYSFTKHQNVVNNLILNCIYCITLPYITLAMFLYDLLHKISTTWLHRAVSYLNRCLQPYKVTILVHAQDLQNKQRQKIRTILKAFEKENVTRSYFVVNTVQYWLKL